MVKTQNEIDAITHSLEVTKGAFNIVEAILQTATVSDAHLVYQGDTLTSEYLHEQVAAYFAAHNFLTPKGSIIASGTDTAEPHHAGSGPIRPGTPIVVDLYPQDTKSGYYGDITRTYVKGEPSVELVKMYAAVAAAHAESMALVRGGVVAGTLHHHACEVLLAAGYHVSKEHGFVHSLGHGLGQEVHELPKINTDSETVLEPGMVITIEPGLYYKNIGGIRIEDTITVTETGFQNLTNHHYLWRV